MSAESPIGLPPMARKAMRLRKFAFGMSAEIAFARQCVNIAATAARPMAIGE